MTTNEPPFASLPDLAKYINGHESRAVEFVQVAATDQDNEFQFKNTAEGSEKKLIDIAQVGADQENNEVANFVNQLIGAGCSPICYGNVFVPELISVIVFRTAQPGTTPPVHEMPDGDNYTYTKASVFGLEMNGTRDPLDGGVGAWGVITADRNVLGAAIPLSIAIAHFGSKNGARNQRIEVINVNNNRRIIVPIVDIGPDEAPGGPVSKGVALDLTLAAQIALGGNGMTSVKYRFVDPASQGSKNAMILDSAERNAGVLSSKQIPGTDHGNLGCAWALNEIVRQAVGHPIGGALSTEDMFTALKHGAGRQVDGPTPGSIIISPTQGDIHGHAGVVGRDGDIYSNSSATGVWSQNYNFAKWNARFRTNEHLPVLFYDIV